MDRGHIVLQIDAKLMPLSDRWFAYRQICRENISKFPENAFDRLRQLRRLENRIQIMFYITCLNHITFILFHNLPDKPHKCPLP